MSSDKGILDLLWEFLTSPFNQYDPWTGERDWPPTIIVGILVLGVVFLVLAAVVAFGTRLYRKARWMARRQHCQHDTCDQQWTTGISDGSESGCVSGQPCCGDCARQHVRDAAQRKADQEPHYNCLHGHGPMKKKAVELRRGVFITIDVCEAKGCGGVWFDGDELKQLKAYVRRAGYNAGYGDGAASGRTSGMAVGIAIGAAT